MTQMSFSDAEYLGKRKQTRRESNKGSETLFGIRWKGGRVEVAPLCLSAP
jgi:hypothetical protein